MLTTRYGFADTPNLGNPSLGWTTVSSPSIVGATTLVVSAVSSFPVATEFDIEIGDRQSDGTVINVEIAHVLSISGTTLTLEDPLTFAHAAAESVYHTLTERGLRENPGNLTLSGDTPFLNAAGRMDRLPAASNGCYTIRFTDGVPSYETGPTFGSVITASDFHWNSGKIANTILAGPVSGSDQVPDFRLLVLADIPDLSSLYIGAAVLAAYAAPLIRTINGHALSSNVTVSASDLGTGTLPLARLAALTTTQFASANISQWTNNSGYAVGSIGDTQVAFGSGTSIAGSARLTWVPPMFSVGGTTTARIDLKTTDHTVDFLLTNLTNRFTVTGAGSYIFDSVVNATMFAYPDTSGNMRVLFNDEGVVSGDANLLWDNAGPTLTLSGLLLSETIQTGTVYGAPSSNGEAQVRIGAGGVEGVGGAILSLESDNNEHSYPELRFTTSEGTMAAPEAVGFNDALIFIRGYGYNGASWAAPVLISARVNGTVSESSIPVELDFMLMGTDGNFTTVTFSGTGPTASFPGSVQAASYLAGDGTVGVTGDATDTDVLHFKNGVYVGKN